MLPALPLRRAARSVPVAAILLAASATALAESRPDTEARLTIALWVDREALGARTAVTECRPRMADLPTSRERIQLRFAARAIPPDTLLHAAPNRKPIGIARDWIPVLEEHRKRRGWTEVTLGTELAPRVWVRADRISHLR